MSRSHDFSLVNMHAMRIYHEEIMDLTRKKHVVKWETSPVGVFKLRHCGLDTFFWNVSSRSWRSNVSSRSWGFNLSVSSRSWKLEKMEHLDLVSVLWLNVLWTSLATGTQSLERYCGASREATYIPRVVHSLKATRYAAQWINIIGLSDPRIIGPSDYRTLGLSDPRTIEPSDYRYITVYSTVL